MKKEADFFLLTENLFHTSYLVSYWYETFKDNPNFKGILLTGDKTNKMIDKQHFHKIHKNKHFLEEEKLYELQTLYGELSKSEKAMINLFGVSNHSTEAFEKTFFIGNDINSTEIQDWLKEQTSDSNTYLYVFLDRILSHWWIDYTNGRIINAHSAVLPFARGMFAIENMAYKGNINNFVQAAGASVHYIDNGIDTGPILRATRMNDPFSFQSIWEVKAYSYKMAFNLLIEQALDIARNPEIQFVGIKPSQERVGPLFYSKNFTIDMQENAAINFMKMKKNY